MFEKNFKKFPKKLKNLLTNEKSCGIIYDVVRKTSTTYGSIAQLGEHLPYKQRVIGSSPIVPIFLWPGSSVG